MMLDDEFFGLVDIAHRLGIRLGELYEMSLVEMHVWVAYFARVNAERQRQKAGSRR